MEMTQNGLSTRKFDSTASTFMAVDSLSTGVEYCFKVKAEGTCG